MLAALDDAASRGGGVGGGGAGCGGDGSGGSVCGGAGFSGSGVLSGPSSTGRATSTRRYPDVVLGADIVYHSELFEPLLEAFDRLIGENTLALLAFVKRWKSSNRFFRRLRKTFDVEALPQLPAEFLSVLSATAAADAFSPAESCLVYRVQRKRKRATAKQAK